MNNFANIQPLRIYEDKKPELERSAFYEKNKYNLKHVFALAPDDLFIPFAINIPSNLTTIAYCKLLCPNDTLQFDFMAKLKNASDLKIISFVDNNGIIQNRLQYIPSDGFYFGGAAVTIPLGYAYLAVRLRNLATGAQQYYRSDLIRIFDKAEAPTGGLLISDTTLIASYFS
jgi:hypothetical protein